MTKCYVVPGFLESELWTPSFPIHSLLLWVSYPRLILGEFGAMRLAPDGINPGPPDGLPCSLNVGLGEYVEAPARQLAGQLRNDGYTVQVVPNDWRTEIYAQSKTLVTSIQATVSPSDPCTIVAHSAGGLVARAAWTELGLTGQQSLVRRIITLGTPHYGSYAAVRIWSLDNSLLSWLFALNYTIGNTNAGLLPSYRRWTLAEIADLTTTWPAMYELLPLLGVETNTDPNRADLYSAGNWDRIIPSQSWLDYSRTQFAPWLLSSASQPPPWVLTCVSGSDRATSAVLADPDQLGFPGALTSAPGDGVVTQVSAELPGATIMRTLYPHDDMLVRSVTAGLLREWILDVRNPPSPAPPLEMVNVLAPQELYGPPASTSPIVPGLAPPPCPGGACTC